jgi:hypothetical protein
MSIPTMAVNQRNVFGSSGLRRPPMHVAVRGRKTALQIRAENSSRGPPQASVSKGLGILEWTGKVVPQGLLVAGG